MMKKWIALLLATVLVFSLAACGGSSEKTEKKASPSSSEQKTDTAETKAPSDNTKTDTPAADTKTLVVYFSRTGEQYGVGEIEKGNTAIVAEMIAEQTGASTFEIKPKNDNYPTTYDALTDVAKEEQNENARPEIKDAVENFDNYDTVFLGYPIWWGDLPMICYTFLESYDFSGKTVIPFCTHAGSGNAGTQSKIESAISGATVKEVLAILGEDTQKKPDSVKETVTDWLNDLGY